eukprot:TRINITY_DN50426_c0_g1_i1.p1 TRINITY_DN50426_c0_g1~~TRINITY_DN50426_c0_g1_i1.p1  ORF type:complete len:1476 (+),score=435.18 TRINITY_DN50426_c0_g1_i1:74-4429(+)
MVRGQSAAGRAATRRQRGVSAATRRQRRGFINLWASPDKDTVPSQDALYQYYKLPEYMKHMDHKQRRPIALDDTNVPGLSREEERVQRIRLLKWRAQMRSSGRAAGAAAAGLPEWERFDAAGRGVLRADWSAAQGMEAALRRGERPDDAGFTDNAEAAAVDPWGVLAAEDADERHERALQAVGSEAPPQEGAVPRWDAVLAGLPQEELRSLQQTYQRFSGGDVLPPLGDLGALHKGLSAWLAGSGEPVTSLQGMRELLALHGRLMQQALPGDDCAAAWRALTEVEQHIDWTRAEWNARLDGEGLPEAALADAIRAYGGGGPRRFWESLLDASALRGDCAVHTRAVLSMTAEQLGEAEKKARALWREVAAELWQRLRREVASGKREAPWGGGGAEWASVAEDYFLKPWAAARESADALAAFADDGSSEYQSELDRLGELYDTPLPGGTTFGEWVRWEMAEAWTVPAQLGERGRGPPAARALGERLSRMEWRGFCDSIMDDHVVRNAAFMPLLTGKSSDGVPVLLYLRRLTLLSNVPGFNAEVPAVTAAAQRAAAAAASAGPAAQLPQHGAALDHVGAYDAAGAVALMCERPGGCDTPHAYAAAKAEARADAQAAALVSHLERLEPGLLQHADGRRWLRMAVEDTQWAIGHLRRCVRSEQRRMPKRVENVKIVGGASEGEWNRGTSRTVEWKWNPYGPQAQADPEQAGRQRVDLLKEQQEELRRIAKQGVDELLKLPERDQKLAESADTSKVDPVLLRRRWAELDWAWVKQATEWRHERERAELEAGLSAAGQHPVHVALYRKATDQVEARKKRWEELRRLHAEAEASPIAERARAAAIAQCARAWAVEQFRASAAHYSPLREEFEVLRRIEQGELDRMLDSGEHLSEGAAEAAGELWEYVCGLEEGGDFVTPNTGNLSVRLPFRRGSEFPYDVAAPPPPGGTHKVVVQALTADGSFLCSGESAEFEVVDSVDALVEQYVSTGRAGRPPLGRASEKGPKELLPVAEVPALLEFLKSPQRNPPLEFDLASETAIGNDTVYAVQPGGDGGMRPAAEPCVHLNVLRYELRADHHREERARDPLAQWALRHEGRQRVAWARAHPGATEEEWAAVRDRELARCADEQAGWWAHDPDAEVPPALDPLDPLDCTQADYLTRKAVCLWHDGTAAARDEYSDGLVAARYEGAGYVSQLTIDPDRCSVAKRIAVPEPQEEVSTVQWVEPGSGNECTIERDDGSKITFRCRKAGAPPGEEKQQTLDRVRYREGHLGPEIVLDTSGKSSAVLPVDGLAEIIGGLRSLTRAADDCATVPARHQLPTEMAGKATLRQIAGLCLEAINDAHTGLCRAHDAALGPLERAAAQRRLQAYSGAVYDTQEAQRRALLLPTVLRAWEDAGSPAAAAAPTGVAVARRRFDSWQLYSGQGRYDESPVQGEEWQHPIEEGPVQYHYDRQSKPLQTM